MSVIERYHWHVSDEVEFKKLHREFYDQYLKKAGAKEMLMNQESSGSWLNFQVDVIFEDWSGKNAWNDFLTPKKVKILVRGSTMWQKLLIGNIF